MGTKHAYGGDVRDRGREGVRGEGDLVVQTVVAPVMFPEVEGERGNISIFSVSI